MAATSGAANSSPERPNTFGLLIVRDGPLRVAEASLSPVDLTPLSKCPTNSIGPPRAQCQESQHRGRRERARKQSTPKSSNKTFTCKLCKHQTDNKDEHWNHIRIHYDPDKSFACKLCPFVTKYRHHLEYHRRNHEGVKPFKCATCNYTCVNLSMLKSHMKSHTHDCPYKCHICVYSSKYAHSLKQHLKKYHQDSRNDQIMLDIFVNGGEAIRRSCVALDGQSVLGSPTSQFSSTSSARVSQDSLFVSHQVEDPADHSCPGLLDLRVKARLTSANIPSDDQSN